MFRDLSSYFFQHFWACLIVLCLLGQMVTFWLWHRLFASKPVRLAVKMGYLFLNLAWIVCLCLFHMGKMRGPWWTFIGRPAISWEIFSFILVIPTVLVGLVWLASRLLAWIIHGWRRLKLDKAREADSGRRLFLKRAGAAGLVAATGLCGFGVLAQTIRPGVARRELFFPGLPAELDGFVICQLTDLHLGMWSNQWELETAIRTAGEEKPDLVVITGDLVDRDPENARLYHEPLRLLRQVPHGVFAVLGNHDHYAGATRVAELLDGYGLTMLVEKRHNLPGAPITIVGLDDQSSGGWMGSYTKRRREGLETDPDALTFGRLTGPARRPGDFSLLLNHRPEGYRQASREGFDLYLAGHTHGGQYQLPWDDQGNLAALFYRYSSGLYHDHDCYLNVSRGLASVGLPFRLFAWPEIDVLTLRKPRHDALSDFRNINKDSQGIMMPM
ncbi:MAG: metallophosphoesterase [Deltaproteobacteria bacterium]|jgi:predicted MPP superfamily phosphohydrolase|nr:metallophosphoesterase [Deltaproteobacteria bacterium]